MKTLAKSLVTSMALAATSMIGPISPLAFAGDMPDMRDPHAHHHMMQMPQTTRRTAEYAVPKVKLLRDDGKTVALQDELNDGRPVVLSFIYTTCTAVCPLVSQTLSQLQRKLGLTATACIWFRYRSIPSKIHRHGWQPTPKNMVPVRNGSTIPVRPRRVLRPSGPLALIAATR